MKNEKTVIFAFRKDAMCFIHVLLNSIELNKKGLDGSIVLEGEALLLVPQMAEPDHMLSGLYQKAREQGLIKGACRACSVNLKVDKEIEREKIPFIDDMSGHPSMGSFIEQGYRIITF